MIRYQLVGSQNSADRIDRVVDGAKTLELDGDPVALTDAQYERISRYARLLPVDSQGEVLEIEDASDPSAVSGRPPADVKDADKSSKQQSKES